MPTVAAVQRAPEAAGAHRPSLRGSPQEPEQRSGGGVWLIVLLGLALRSYHLARGPSVWHDEAALIMNALGKGFADLLGPLFYAEAAPPLFLWIERAASTAFGESAWAFRLYPFFASCAALVLFVLLARRVLPRSAAPWAVLLLACSDRLLWHACEAKPYSSDTLVAVILGWLYSATRIWRPEHRSLLFATLAPGLMFLSYPACFLYGGVLLALGIELWPYRRTRVGLAFVLLAAGAGCAFAVLYLGPVRAQRCAAMEQCWETAFPPWNQPWTLPWWLACSGVGVIDYCSRPSGGLLLLLIGTGAVHYWRRRRHDLVALFAAPALLALVAACLHAYPFTGARVLVYAAPGLFLLTAAGVPPTIEWLRQPIVGQYRAALPRVEVLSQQLIPGAASCITLPRELASRPARTVWLLAWLACAALILQLLLPAGWALYRVVDPWYRADFPTAAAFLDRARQPGDAVVSNAWEADYYFRHWPAASGAPARRWLVVAGKLPADARATLADELTPDEWHTVADQAFTGVTVFLQERTVATVCEPPAAQ